jgi:hypothetical protein
MHLIIGHHIDNKVIGSLGPTSMAILREYYDAEFSDFFDPRFLTMPA